MIVDIIDLGEYDISHIREVAEQEGYNILNHLVIDYESGKNRFDKEGEKLSGFVLDNMIMASCGLNIEPTDTEYGRIRRLYVLPEYRNRGIGTDLVNHLIAYARNHYKGIVVNIGTLPINRFYESKGFSSVNNPSFTHLLLF